ncbi:leucine-rich repeat-containing protein 41 [Bombina bombina]|uniref:leucine-rich repeat-containing protein 41 n=1 Tax=Bombina bombina TaxID=8345 RepID=UPI00235B303B|nr:leucine-rich repeat-containing protein 41 [Bombina bombina]
MEESVEDAGGTPTLFEICARAVTANMETLEQDVWGLPAVILQGILPLLNIYYLERIEQAAVKKGLSTQSIWRKLWNDVMKCKPSRFGTVTCWRKKFLEAFFHNVLRGILDVSSDRRLSDHRFSPLVHSSRHVSELTICNKQQGVSELTPAVLESLAQSVETLKFLHLRSSDLTTQKSLRSLLHRLIHHGQVNKVSLLSWPSPDTNLLVLILSISAGFWQKHKNSQCVFCLKKPRNGSSEVAQEQRLDSDLLQAACTTNFSGIHSGQSVEEEVSSQSALLSLQPLNINQNVSTNLPECNIAGETQSSVLRVPGNCQTKKVTCRSSSLPSTASESTSIKNLKTGANFQGNFRSEPEDLYDFIFSVSGKEEGKALDISNGYRESANRNPPELAAVHLPDIVAPMEQRRIEMPFLDGAQRLRSVKALNLHNVPLSLSSCRTLCHLLRSWVSLERLTMAYNDLGTNIFLLVEALTALSRCPGCCLSVISMSDFTTYVSTLDLVHIILTMFPSLQLLSLSYDLENHNEKEKSDDSPTEFRENNLKQLEIRFPQDPLHVGLLTSVLKASLSLLELSFDNATFLCQEDLRCVLRTIAEHNTSMRRLSFHDMKLTDAHSEILLLINKLSLEEVKFSFCRLFEKDTSEFLIQFVNSLKRNSSIKILKLCGNRLGNDGLAELADIYSADSLSSIHYLDVSSNCIKPEGLLQFAKKLEGCGKIKLRHLSLSQNLLDRDPMLAQEALQTLEGVCSVFSDSWNSSQAFADHVSVM